MRRLYIFHQSSLNAITRATAGKKQNASHDPLTICQLKMNLIFRVRLNCRRFGHHSQ